MRIAFVWALIASVSMGISACNKAESPEKVQTDVANATTEAAEKNAKAEDSVKQTESQAAQDLAKERSDDAAKAADKSIGALSDAAVTEAEGTTKIALAKCEALEGDAQKQCKDQANAHLQEVKDRAKAAKAQ
jgi:hypothetical protein